MEAFSAPMYVAFRGPLQASCESFAPVAYQTQASMCPAKMIANTVPIMPAAAVDMAVSYVNGQRNVITQLFERGTTTQGTGVLLEVRPGQVRSRTEVRSDINIMI